jgi:hypothetical protein
LTQIRLGGAGHHDAIGRHPMETAPPFSCKIFLATLLEVSLLFVIEWFVSANYGLGAAVKNCHN